jgi:hypothetical protein
MGEALHDCKWPSLCLVSLAQAKSPVVIGRETGGTSESVWLFWTAAICASTGFLSSGFQMPQVLAYSLY